MFDAWPIVVSAICAVVLMPLAICARSIGRDAPGVGRKLHDVPTSRLGGVIVFAAYLAVLGSRSGSVTSRCPPRCRSLSPRFPSFWSPAGGHHFNVRPRYRMGAAVVSAALASAFAGGVIPRLDLPLIDDLLRHMWIVLPLTWFMVAGSCNAMNLIDGTNGLAAGTALIMFGGIAAAAGWSGDAATLAEALAMMGALAGFMVWNYPRGRVFLGDAGAYFIGFMYAQLSIRLIARNDDLSAWYVILLAAYPIVDTLFAMYRRGVIRHTQLMSPDALHLHSLIFRRVAMPIERRQSEMSLQRANARVAPRLWLHSAACFVLAVLFHRNTPLIWMAIAAYALFYIASLPHAGAFRAHAHAAVDGSVENAHDEAKQPKAS